MLVLDVVRNRVVGSDDNVEVSEDRRIPDSILTVIDVVLERVLVGVIRDLGFPI